MDKRQEACEAFEIRTNDAFIKTTVQKYMAPSVAALIGSTLTIVANSMIVGNYIGAEGLAALNLVNPVYFAFATLGALINVGASTGASVCIGKNDRRRADSYVTLALVLTLLLPVAMTAAGLLFFDQLMAALGTTARMEPYVRAYAGVLVTGGISVSLMYYPFNFLKADGRPRQGTYMFLLMFVLDLLFCALFLGIFDMGIRGVALAFVLSTLLGDIFGLCLLFGRKTEFTLGNFSDIPGVARDIFKTGSSMALNNLCNIFRTIALNYLILHALSGKGLAIFAVVGAVTNFSNAVISGIGQTITPLIGVFHGERDYISIQTVVREAVRKGIKGILALTVLVCIFARPIGAAFGVTGLPRLVPALWLFAASFLPGMLTNLYISYYFTAEHIGLANLLTLLRGFILPVLSAFCLTRAGAAPFIWLSFAISELLTLAVISMTARHMHQKNPSLEGWLLLDRRYKEPERYLAFSVENTAAAAADASGKVAAFCEKQHMSPKTAMTISLAVEELLLIVFQHCLHDREEQYADVRIIRMQDEIILYMRCAGKLFDPVAYYERRKAEAARRGEVLTDDSLGIEMIVKQAEKVLFGRTFGMNNLTILLREAENCKAAS